MNELKKAHTAVTKARATLHEKEKTLDKELSKVISAPSTDAPRSERRLEDIVQDKGLTMTRRGRGVKIFGRRGAELYSGGEDGARTFLAKHK